MKLAAESEDLDSQASVSQPSIGIATKAGDA